MSETTINILFPPFTIALWMLLVIFTIHCCESEIRRIKLEGDYPPWYYEFAMWMSPFLAFPSAILIMTALYHLISK